MLCNPASPPPEHRAEGVSLVVGARAAWAAVATPLQYWTHFCHSLQEGRLWRTYANGLLVAEGQLQGAPGAVQAGGVFIVGGWCSSEGGGP